MDEQGDHYLLAQSQKSRIPAKRRAERQRDGGKILDFPLRF
jgi:hypothetical protein